MGRSRCKDPAAGDNELLPSGISKWPFLADLTVPESDHATSAVDPLRTFGYRPGDSK